MVTNKDSSDSRKTASELITDLTTERLAGIEDDEVRKVLTPEVVDAVFDAAWEHQFDRDRTVIRQELREIVQKAVTEVVDSDAD